MENSTPSSDVQLAEEGIVSKYWKKRYSSSVMRTVVIFISLERVIMITLQ